MKHLPPVFYYKPLFRDTISGCYDTGPPETPNLTRLAYTHTHTLFNKMFNEHYTDQ